MIFQTLGGKIHAVPHSRKTYEREKDLIFYSIDTLVDIAVA